jgi:hypothetical protein
MNTCTLPVKTCAFCSRRGERRLVFIEERLTSRKPVYEPRCLPVCRAHADPFSQDDFGRIPQMILATLEDGSRAVIVALARDFVGGYGARRRSFT